MTRAAWCQSFGLIPNIVQAAEETLQTWSALLPPVPCPTSQALKISSRDVMALDQAGYFGARWEKTTLYTLSYL